MAKYPYEGEEDPMKCRNEVISNTRQHTPVAGLLEAAHELVEEHHFAGRHDEAVHGVAVIVGAAEIGLRALKQEWVVAALLQLRDDVQQADLGAPLCAL